MSGDFALEMAMCEDELGRPRAALPAYRQAIAHYKSAIDAFLDLGARDSAGLSKCQRRYEQCCARIREVEAKIKSSGPQDLTDDMMRRMPLAPGAAYKPMLIPAADAGADASHFTGPSLPARASAGSGLQHGTSRRAGAGAGAWQPGQLVLTTPFGMQTAGSAGSAESAVAGGGGSPGSIGGGSNRSSGLSPMAGQSASGLSAGEYALIRTTTINGKSYPLWDEDEVRREQFAFPYLYEDPDGLLDLSR